MITEAHDGTGYVTAQTLLMAGANVIVASSSDWRTQDTYIRLIDDVTPEARKRISCVTMDLQSLSSIEAGVKEFVKLNVDRLDAICFNAGVMLLPKYKETKDGLEMQWGVNHVGQFYLFQLLLPTIIDLPGETRIVIVSSVAHYDTPNDFTVRTHLPPTPDTYGRSASYGISKICNILMAREITKRFRRQGISAYSLQPGFVTETSLYSRLPVFVPYILKCCAFAHCCCLWHADFKSVRKGASTQLFLMTWPKDLLSSGGYYVGCRRQDRGSALYKYPMTENDEEGENLWKLTENIIKDCQAKKFNRDSDDSSTNASSFSGTRSSVIEEYTNNKNVNIELQ